MKNDLFEKIFKKQLIEKYYTPKELEYDLKVGTLISPFDFQKYLDYKEQLIENRSSNFINYLPLKVFNGNGKYLYFVRSSETNKLIIDLLEILASDLFTNRVFYSRKYDNVIMKSRIYSEIEGTLNVENVPTTRKRLKELLGEDRPPETLNDTIIINMNKGIRFIQERPDFNKDNLLSLYKILSKDCLEKDQKLLNGDYYRYDSVEIGRYNGCPANEIDGCMDSLFKYVSSIINNKEDDQIEKFLLPHICHYYILYIHPYFDYNGRTARMVSFWINLLVNNEIVPPIISEGISEKKHQYYRALELTRDNRNDLTYFINFILELCLDISLCYLNLDYIQDNLRKRYIDVTETDINYIKRILLFYKGPFKYSDFNTFCNIDISKQGALKILNRFIYYGILKEVETDTKSKFFEINIKSLKYKMKNFKFQ